MLFELIAEVAELLLIVVCLHLALRTYLRHNHASWSEPVEKRRLAVLLILVLAVTAVKVSEDVLGGESGLVDEALLLSIHDRVPSTLTGFFEAVTFTGSPIVLLPLTSAVTLALLFASRRFEALLLSASVLSGAAVVYLVKTAVGRTRPALWRTDWYWGSSFPSGHTLVVAAFATATVLCVSRIWPRARAFALPMALLWIALVGFSRLVIGVHWPTDVLAAACIGAFLPLAMGVALELRRA